MERVGIAFVMGSLDVPTYLTWPLAAVLACADCHTAIALIRHRRMLFEP